MSSDEDIPYPPYGDTIDERDATLTYRPHSRQLDSGSDIEEPDWTLDELATRDYHLKVRARGAKFGYVDAEDEEGREFQVPCCTLCDKSWCDTLTCKRNPIKKCTSCSWERIGNEYVFSVGDEPWQKNRKCRTRQPPRIAIVDPRYDEWGRGGRSRKRTKRKKRRKTKKKTRRKKRRKRKTKKRRRTKRK